MPFVKLSNSNHKCKTPTTRDDGSPLVIGDEWMCNEPLSGAPFPECGKVYTWTNDQREGNYWMPITFPRR